MYQTHYVPAYTNHLLHLVLTLVSFGLWLPVWITLTIMNMNRTVARNVWVPMPAPQYTPGVYGQTYLGQTPPAPVHRWPGVS